ncbi:hypothetical protein Taro_000270 [Colocasia esculenta]|uniref:Uncharacterized protein n=1 Tax=Colocasia esculenta TaxID=4460 RepID=A0A843TEE6_COLES|nr:hypothetical protein [Colocasia esculenta]
MRLGAWRSPEAEACGAGARWCSRDGPCTGLAVHGWAVLRRPSCALAMEAGKAGWPWFMCGAPQAVQTCARRSAPELVRADVHGRAGSSWIRCGQGERWRHSGLGCGRRCKEAELAGARRPRLVGDLACVQSWRGRVVLSLEEVCILTCARNSGQRKCTVNNVARSSWRRCRGGIRLRAPEFLKLPTGAEESLDDRRTRGIAELCEETSQRGAIRVGARGGLGVNRGIAGDSNAALVVGGTDTSNRHWSPASPFRVPHSSEPRPRSLEVPGMGL